MMAPDAMAPSDAETSFLAVERELSERWPASESIYAHGVTLVKQGFRAEYIYLVINGIVKLSFVEKYGREFISHLRFKHCIIGAEGALLEVPSLLTATTLTECKIRHFPAGGVRNALKTSANLAFHMSRSIARESVDQTTAMIDAASGNARHRLLNLLRQFNAGRTGPPGLLPLGVPLKKHEIAKLLAVTPEHLSRLIRILQREGVVRSEKRAAVLNNTTKRPHESAG